MFKIIYILCIFFSLLINNNVNMNYKYNDNGRIIIPSSDDIEKLPYNGGSLWNRLIFESSPYLLQHAANPVDWYPWGTEAFDLAKKLNKPIFLSIGYTTCHWCHVMEHESFEDEDVARLMNDSFINIKVDREERPDIDNVYMEVTQKLTGRGGWPMTVVMTPDKKPFFAGTYFPKKTRPRYNRTGMLDLVPTLKDLWINKQDSLTNSAQNIVSDLVKANNSRNNKSGVQLNSNLIKNSFKIFSNKFDDKYGGFKGSRNKFPKPHDYSFIAKYYYSSKDTNALNILNKSLYEMKKGGLYDQIGYGFHRYSTDQKWLVPHFEKMLYDQAMIIHAYLDAFLVTNDAFYKKTVDEVCTYVLRDMYNENSGFYSAEDADSEGEEGVFYIWEYNEIKDLLKDSEFIFLQDVLNIEESGNAIVEGHRTNIPHFSNNWPEIAYKYDNSVEGIIQYYNSIRKKIFDHRELRIHPQKDDKILTDWNGLMISALARASVILDDTRYLDAAKSSADFIIKNLIQDDGKLLKRFRGGVSGIDGMIEDYSFFIWGLIELYQSTFEYKYIEVATKLSDYQIENFWDIENKGFFFTSKQSEELIIRSKEVYDGAIPSGNSVSANNFIRLGRILSSLDYEKIAYDLTDSFAPNLNRYSIGSTMMLQAINFMDGPSFEVIITGDKKQSKSIIDFIQKHPQPNKVLIFKSDKENQEMLSYLKKYPSENNGETKVYICQNYSCQLPTNDINKIKELLK